MKKLSMIPVAALALAACSESPMAPAFEGGPSFIALHTAIPVPTGLSSSVVAATTGSDVTISWNWQDGEDAWDLVSFTVTRDGVSVPGTIANAKPYSAGAVLSRSLTDSGVADGTYTYCVEVMAKYFEPTPAVTQHSFACKTVTVGADVYSIRVMGGSAANSTFNKNAANFNFSYEFLLNGAVITDCAIAPTVATNPGSLVKQHNCDAVTGQRNILFENPAKGTSTSFTGTWGYNAVTIYTHLFQS